MSLKPKLLSINVPEKLFSLTEEEAYYWICEELGRFFNLEDQLETLENKVWNNE